MTDNKDMSADESDEVGDDPASWSNDDEARWQAAQAESDTDESPLLARVITQMRGEYQVTLAVEAEDELAFRRWMKDIKSRHAQLTPADLERMDAEIAVFDNANASLAEGRAALDRGDLQRAAYLLNIAAAHGVGDSIQLLAATYRAQRRDALAAAWLEIAVAEGFNPHEIRRLAHHAYSRAQPTSGPANSPRPSISMSRSATRATPGSS